MSTPRFLVSSAALAGDQAVISGAELHHVRVRRLRIGCRVALTDGQGHEREGVLTELSRGHAVVSLAQPHATERESSLRLVLAQALLKGNKMDLVVQKATELGAAEVLVFPSERSLRSISSERRARWERIAASAAKQAQRRVVPPVIPLASLREVLSHAVDLRICFWEAAATSSGPRPSTVTSVLALVGPEGGFSADEAAQAAACGCLLVQLGPRILRAETAAIVALTLCQYHWGDLRPAR